MPARVPVWFVLELSARGWLGCFVTVGARSAVLLVLGRGFLGEAAEGVNYASLQIFKTLYIFSYSGKSLADEDRCEMQARWKGSPWGPAAGMVDGHRVTCTWLSPGLSGREERRSNSCPRRAAPQGARLQGSSLKVPDTPLAVDKFSVNLLLSKYSLYFHRDRNARLGPVSPLSPSLA